MADSMRFWSKWLYAITVDADKEASAIALGDPRETISSRLGKAGRGDFGVSWRLATWPLRRLVNTVAWIGWGQPDHCAWAIDDGVGDQGPLNFV